jgi:hypothetical protein
VPTGALLTGIVQQSLSYILPYRLRPIQTDCISFLDFDEPHAAAAGHPQNVVLKLG